MAKPWHMPMGYTLVDGKIEIHEEARLIVEQIFRDYAAGESTNGIANKLREVDGDDACNSRKWTHASVGRILENTDYLGTEQYPQIIDKELFDRVQERREQIRVKTKRGKYRPGERERQLFGGVMVCAECGAACEHTALHCDLSENRLPKWRCKTYLRDRAERCRNIILTDSQTEQACIRAVNQLIEHPEITGNYKRRTADGRAVTGSTVRGRAEATRAAEQDSTDVTPAYRKIEREIQKAEDLPAERLKDLLFERASERYKTLTVRDEEIQTERMREALKGKEPVTEFDEELYRSLIKKIIIHKGGEAEVVFHNNSRVMVRNL